VLIERSTVSGASDPSPGAEEASLATFGPPLLEKCVLPAPLCCQPVVWGAFRGGVFRTVLDGCSVGRAGPGSG
jgi:hypothetical protein